MKIGLGLYYDVDRTDILYYANQLQLQMTIATMDGFKKGTKLSLGKRGPVGARDILASLDKTRFVRGRVVKNLTLN